MTTKAGQDGLKVPMGERLYRNARLLTMRQDQPGLGEIERGAIACHAGRILYAGAESDLSPRWRTKAEAIDCAGRWITPGLIDCHTHLVYAGNRAQEFEQRLAGASYEEVARTGGGIRASVAATRAASEDDLFRQSLPRLDRLIAEGVTFLEVKSGYGLELETEAKQLRVARRLATARPIAVTPTYLAAHALPAEFAADRAAYVDRIVTTDLPEIARRGLADALDAFCERIAFSPAEVERVFDRAQRLGLPVKLHADQLSNQGGAALAARYHALSADHLEYADRTGVRAMARAGTIAVLLPGAAYFLRETQVPPVALFRAHGVPMAIATDCNPGTSPLTSLLLAMNMAAVLFRMTVPECLAAVTREAARALGALPERGTLEAGKYCDLAIWDIERPAELVYAISRNPLHARVFHGVAA